MSMSPNLPNKLTHKDWDRRVRAAYFLLLGTSVEDVAAAVERSPTQINDWRRQEWWPDAQEEATIRWDSDLLAKARIAVMEGLEAERSNPKSPRPISRWVIERRVPKYRPPARNEAEEQQPFIVGGAPAGIQRNPDSEGALPEGTNPANFAEEKTKEN